MANFSLPKGFNPADWGSKGWLGLISLSIIVVEALIGATLEAEGTFGQKAIRVIFHLILGFAGGYLGRDMMKQVLQSMYTILLFTQGEIKSVTMIVKETGEAIVSIASSLLFPWWLFLYIARGLNQVELITSFSFIQMLTMAPLGQFHQFSFMMCGTIIIFYAGYLCNLGLSFIYMSGKSRQAIIQSLLLEASHYKPFKEMLGIAKGLSRDEKKDNKPKEDPDLLKQKDKEKENLTPEEKKIKTDEIIKKNDEAFKNKVVNDLGQAYDKFQIAIKNSVGYESVGQIVDDIEKKPNPGKEYQALRTALSGGQNVFSSLINYLKALKGK